jgi:phosphatidylserine decarboxylase
MQAKLQGDATNVPHPLVDARDLKYVRNVANCWFAPVDDPWTGRSVLGFAHYGVAELVGFTLLAGLLSGLIGALAVGVHPAFGWLAVPVFVVWLEVPWFFRDPHRSPPTDPAALVAPADGTVTHVETVTAPDFPNGQAVRISIFLSIFSVHVNRVPCSGTVERCHYFPGAYLDARSTECAQRNEQLWLDLRHAGRLVRLKQIAGAIARRIVCWPRIGEALAAGARYGMIKFGSRTDLLVADADAVVRVGDRVRGGETIVARWRNGGTEISG